MARSRLQEIEAPIGNEQLVDCVEIYMPKSIELLAELYHFLREKVTNRFGEVVLDGFSVYEVDGLFRGEQLWEQRTLVIRLMFLRPPGRNVSAVEMRVTLLGQEIATSVAKNEEEIWICHYPQVLRVFRGVKRLLP